MSFHRLCNNLINIQKANLFFQKFLYRKLVGRIKDSRHASAFPGCLDRHRKSAECLHIRNLKCDLTKFREIKTVSIQITSVWIVQSVLDRKSHIRSSKLRHDRTVFKFHHGMNDTLRLHHHLDMIQIHIKQPSGFHNFQALVYQGRGIYGDLPSHYPVWMFQSICNRDISKLFCSTSAERAAGCRDQKFMDLFVFFSVDSLENGAVFTIYRKDGYTIFSCHWHDQMTCRDKSLFIGQGNILSGTDSLHGRTDPDHSHDRSDQDIGFRHGRKFQKPFHSADYLCVSIRNTCFQVPGCLFIPDRCQNRVKFPDLLFQFLHTFSRTDCNNTKVFVFSCHIQCLGSDGAGRT